MAHESPGRDFRQLPESIPRALQSSGSPLGRSWQADDALSLRFLMFLGQRPLIAYAFQCSGSLGRSRCTPALPNRPEASKGQPFFYGFLSVSGLGLEPLRKIQGPLLLIQYTCFLILDTCHLSLVLTYTCTYTLFLYLMSLYT